MSDISEQIIDVGFDTDRSYILKGNLLLPILSESLFKLLIAVEVNEHLHKSTVYQRCTSLKIIFTTG